MHIQSGIKTYDVYFENNLSFWKDILNTKNAEFVIDKNIYHLYSEWFMGISAEKLCIIEATEQNKILDTALDICEKITEIPAKRNAVLVSVGGGIIQDITGFVANVVYRGIHWIFVPTTLLAACDSCIGGKTSLNYKKYKNLLGTFYPPDEIHICSEVFDTLCDRDFYSGLGEVIKFNIMAGIEGLINIENNISKLLIRDRDTVERFVESSLLFKKSFIEIDEFDRGERIKLNFAHTFGHSIEVVTDYEIPHGTAVAIGMIMADYISLCRGWIDADMISRSERVLLQVIDINPELLNKPLDDYLKAIRKDKKQVSDSLTAVLISKYGLKSELKVVHDVKEIEIENAIKYFIDVYNTKRAKE